MIFIFCYKFINMENQTNKTQIINRKIKLYLKQILSIESLSGEASMSTIIIIVQTLFEIFCTLKSVSNHHINFKNASFIMLKQIRRILSYTNILFPFRDKVYDQQLSGFFTPQTVNIKKTYNTVILSCVLSLTIWLFFVSKHRIVGLYEVRSYLLYIYFVSDRYKYFGFFLYFKHMSQNHENLTLFLLFKECLF